MSLYNTFRATIACPDCHSVAEREIQFRYGHVWQHEYVLGSTIIWGPAAVGDPSAARVIVDGWIVECNSCGRDGRIALFLRDNVIWGFGPIAWAPGLSSNEWLVDNDFAG